MNALFGVLEESGEGDLRYMMSSGLGLKSSWSSLDGRGRVSGVKALLPLVKIAPGILLRVGFFSPRILCTARSRALTFFAAPPPVPLEWLFLSLRPLIKYQVLPFRLELSSGDARGRGFFKLSRYQIPGRGLLSNIWF